MKIDLTNADLMLFQHEARNQFQNLPANVELELVKRPLTTQDFVTVCHMRAAIMVLASKGLVPVESSVEVKGEDLK